MYKIYVPFALIIAILFLYNNCAVDTRFQAQTANVAQEITLRSFSNEIHLQEFDVVPRPTTYSLVLADRYYLASLLTDVFGPTAAAVDSTRHFLNAIDFGSPCDLYETYLDSDDTLYNEMENCRETTASRINALVSPSPSANRQGLLTRACSDLSSNLTTVKHALEEIDDEEALPAATRTNIIRLYQLFYRGKPNPDNSVIDSLELIIRSRDGEPSLVGWESAIFTVCASSYWQVQ